jgi:hypothetical protein
MKFAIVYQGKNNNPTIHRDGCKDISKFVDSGVTRFEADNLEEAVIYTLNDLNSACGYDSKIDDSPPWDRTNIEIMQCARK